MLYTLLTLVALILTLLLNVFGKKILTFFELHDLWIYHPLAELLRHMHLYSLVLLTVYFSALYLFLPNRRERFLHVLPGALAAAAAWLVFSECFSYYVNNLGHYSSLYGGLSTIPQSGSITDWLRNTDSQAVRQRSDDWFINSGRKHGKPLFRLLSQQEMPCK